MEMYLGPMEYDTVKALGRGVEQTMNLGAAWIIRPIAEYVMIPLFKFLHLFIPNFGIVIIIFSLIIKIGVTSADTHEHEGDASDAGVDAVDERGEGEVQG